MKKAVEFFEQFKAVYETSRAGYEDSEWNEIWGSSSRWSSFMLYDQESVIRQIAQPLGLVCFRGEPLHIDAIFTKTQAWDWFPISIALEHENNPASFHGEISKLLSIKCPLKVGVTYAIMEKEPDNPGKRLDDVKKRIEREFISRLNSIDHSVRYSSEEYLFIIGFETEPKVIRWHYSTVTSHDGPLSGFNWL